MAHGRRLIMCQECEREEYQQYIDTEVENAGQTNEQIVQEMLFEKVKALNQKVKERTDEISSKEIRIKYLEQKIQDLEKTLENRTWGDKSND